MPSPASPSPVVNAAILRGGVLDGRVVHGPQGDPIQVTTPDGRRLSFAWGLPGGARFAVRLSSGTVVRHYYPTSR